MIIILKPDLEDKEKTLGTIRGYLEQFPGIKVRLVELQGETREVTEVHLIGPTQPVREDVIEHVPGVERVVRVSAKYRQIGRHDVDLVPIGFKYQGLTFDQDSLHVFAGLCAVETREFAEEIFKNLQSLGISTARMGAYKPRTSPYDFQGHGAKCLPWLFELAGKYGIKVIAMEVLREQHIDEIFKALDDAGRPTGIMLQIGTRNAQNFELLKAVGSQKELPVLYKRGMGLTLEESLNACEYIASEGNRNIIFCLRGVKSQLGLPHRNIVDFTHVPVVRRLTRLPVCVDPSHSVGIKARGPEGLLDIFHASAQGVIAGANMILVECHPAPDQALCDGPQALTMDEFRKFVRDVQVVREAYLKRLQTYSQEMMNDMTRQ